MINHAEEIIGVLIRAKIINPNTKQRAIKILNKQWSDRRIIVWGIVDIIDRAKETKRKIPTKERAQEILDEMMHRHDCNYGITWDTIDHYLEEKD